MWSEPLHESCCVAWKLSVSDSLRPLDCTPPGSSVLEFSGNNTRWVAMPSPTGSSQPRDQTPLLLCLQHWQTGSLPLNSPGSPIYMMYRIWHNFKRWKEMILCGFCFLSSCTFTHSSWVSLFLAQYLQLFLKAQPQSSVVLANMEQGSRRRLAQWDRVTSI